jgi:hypothetical protein
MTFMKLWMACASDCAKLEHGPKADAASHKLV